MVLACIAKSKASQFKKTIYCSNNHTYSNAHHYIGSVSEMGKDSWVFEQSFYDFSKVIKP